MEELVCGLHTTLVKYFLNQSTDLNFTLFVVAVADRTSSHDEIQRLVTAFQREIETLWTGKSVQSQIDDVHKLQAQTNVDGVDHQQIVRVAQHRADQLCQRRLATFDQQESVQNIQNFSKKKKN